MSKQNKNVFTFTVKCEMGSDFQYENAIEMITLTLDACKKFYESRHKDTNIKIRLEENGKQ